MLFKKSFHNPEFNERTWLEWLFKYELKECKKPKGKDVLLGRFLYLFHLWKFADKKTVKYISKKTDFQEG